MKNEKIAETVKNVIEEDLFVDVDTRSCVIDYFLQNPKEFEKRKDALNKVSLTFFDARKTQLKSELDKGNILFFRKYNYEKILNDYLCKNYQVESLEIDLLSFKMEPVDSAQKIKEEVKRAKRAKKEKEREEKEREVLSNLDNVIWFKVIKKNYIYYKGMFRDGKELELRINNTKRRSKQASNSYLKYDNKKISYVEYDINVVIDTIQKTYSKNEKIEAMSRISDTKELKKTEAEIERERIKEERKKEEQKKNREQLSKELELISNIGNIKWEKIIGANYFIYKGTFRDNKVVEFRVNNTMKKKNPTAMYILRYDKKPVRYAEYNGDEIVELIEKTHPIIKKNDKIIAVVHKERMSSDKKTQNTISPETEKKRKEEIEKRKVELEVQQKLKRERERIHNERMRAEQEAKRLRDLEKQKRRQLQEQEEQESLKQLPQIGAQDFVVRRAVFKCMHAKHEVIDLTAAVKIVNDDGKGKLVKVAAGYCKKCKIYFIMESTYQKIRNMGIVVCRISDEKSYLKNPYINGMRLANESILMQFGYTVSQVEGLSSTKRQKILAVIIDNHILTKTEIISYLDFFINQRKYQSRFELAISKWEADREFVQEYRIGEFTQFGVNAIYRR